MRQFRQENFFSICKSCEIGCCRGARPPIITSRRMTIEKYLRAEGVKIEEPFVKSLYTFPREDENGYCIFFDRGTRKCRVYPVKPETCVSGTITFDINPKTGKIEWFLKMEKICPLAGILCENKKTLFNHLKSAKRELLILVHDLDAKELNAILKIEEPETFKIGEDEVDPEILTKLRLFR